VPTPLSGEWRRPTRADVASVAGVSATTVSLVLNNKGQRFPAKTAQRVRDAAQSLGYRPNRAAQSLRRGSTGTIGVITDRIAKDAFSGSIIGGLNQGAWAHENVLLLLDATLDRTRMSVAVDTLLDHRVDALVFASIGTRQVHIPHAARQVPLMLINAFSADEPLPCILPDEYAGGRAAAEHLLGLGHTRIALLSGFASSWAGQARVRGYRDAMEAHGLNIPAGYLRYGNYRFDSGYAMATAIMARPDAPTALLCGNDQMAAGAYLALARLGLRVPEDISVVGYDNEPLAARLAPPLTTIEIPFHRMGSLATDTLLSGSELSTEPVLIDCPLVTRESTAPAPAL